MIVKSLTAFVIDGRQQEFDTVSQGHDSTSQPSRRAVGLREWPLTSSDEARIEAILNDDSTISSRPRRRIPLVDGVQIAPPR